MTTRREALGLLGSISIAPLLAARSGLGTLMEHPAGARAEQGDATPPLAPGSPMSPERRALIDAFKEKSAGVEQAFEARTHKSDRAMP